MDKLLDYYVNRIMNERNGTSYLIYKLEEIYAKNINNDGYLLAVVVY